jgi:pimeloyl-ACP methyl ester carboxylesterase
MKRLLPILLLAVACTRPAVIEVDFDTFQVIDVKSSDLFMEDGSLNPEVRMMEDAELPDGEDTKVARTDIAGIARNMLGVINCNRLIQVSGIFTGHDVDGITPLKQSGKLVLPADGPIRNLILVSHYTIGANFEAPSETFPLEAMFAAKGYAVIIADYIGYGVTVDHIHPYMHTRSTAQSVVDMAVAVKPYLEHIGRKPESDKVILAGYSQGGSTTLAVMNILQEQYADEFPILKVYAGGGPYDLAATYDYSMEVDVTGIPCAIPMIVQGINEGEDLGLKMEDFFKGNLLEHYKEWINSRQYTVAQINKKIGSRYLHEIMTDKGRDKTSRETANLYKALLKNSVLNFTPRAPIYMFHSRQDQTVPFINAIKAENYFKLSDIHYNFGDYGKHSTGCVRFILLVYNEL